jgi:hypothetical protein
MISNSFCRDLLGNQVKAVLTNRIPAHHLVKTNRKNIPMTFDNVFENSDLDFVLLRWLISSMSTKFEGIDVRVEDMSAASNIP